GAIFVWIASVNEAGSLAIICFVTSFFDRRNTVSLLRPTAVHRQDVVQVISLFPTRFSTSDPLECSRNSRSPSTPSYHSNTIGHQLVRHPIHSSGSSHPIRAKALRGLPC